MLFLTYLRGIGAGREGIPLSLSNASIVEFAGVLEREGSTSVGDGRVGPNPSSGVLVRQESANEPV